MRIQAMRLAAMAQGWKPPPRPRANGLTLRPHPRALTKQPIATQPSPSAATSAKMPPSTKHAAIHAALKNKAIDSQKPDNKLRLCEAGLFSLIASDFSDCLFWACARSGKCAVNDVRSLFRNGEIENLKSRYRRSLTSVAAPPVAVVAYGVAFCLNEKTLI